MAWIEAHDELPDHPKTVLYAYELKIDKDAMTGKMLRFWTWALQNRRSGFIPYSDMQTVAERMRWTKKPQRLFDVLCMIPPGFRGGFLDPVDGGYVIHDWEQYTNAYYGAENRREKDRKRKQDSKEIPLEFRRKSGGNPKEFQGNSTEKIRNSASYRNLTVPTTEEEEYSAPAREGTEVRCFDEYSTLIQPSSRLSDETLQSFLDDGAEDEMICAVIAEAHANDGRTLSYVRTALQRSMDRGVLTAAQYAESQRRWAERGQDGGRNRGHGPPTHNGGLPPNSPNLLL